MYSKGRALNDRGSGTVLGLTLVLLGVLMFSALQLPLRGVYELARLQNIADSAALAAEDSLRGITTGIPCEVADVVVAANHAEIASCKIYQNSVYLSVRSLASGAPIVAEAAAAPSVTE